jgi:hypothetical protein
MRKEIHVLRNINSEGVTEVGEPTLQQELLCQSVLAEQTFLPVVNDVFKARAY